MREDERTKLAALKGCGETHDRTEDHHITALNWAALCDACCDIIIAHQRREATTEAVEVVEALLNRPKEITFKAGYLTEYVHDYCGCTACRVRKAVAWLDTVRGTRPETRTNATVSGEGRTESSSVVESPPAPSTDGTPRIGETWMVTKPCPEHKGVPDYLKPFKWPHNACPCKQCVYEKAGSPSTDGTGAP